MNTNFSPDIYNDLGSISPNFFAKQKNAGAHGVLAKYLPFNFTNDSLTETVNHIFGKTRKILQKCVEFL
jgi:hypothetical protein